MEFMMGPTQSRRFILRPCTGLPQLPKIAPPLKTKPSPPKITPPLPTTAPTAEPVPALASAPRPGEWRGCAEAARMMRVQDRGRIDASAVAHIAIALAHDVLTDLEG